MIAENLCSPTVERGSEIGEDAFQNAHRDSGTVNSSFNSTVEVSLSTFPTFIPNFQFFIKDQRAKLALYKGTNFMKSAYITSLSTFNNHTTENKLEF